MQFYIKNNYYFDIDIQNQLRISGPENHLFLGLTFPEKVEVVVRSYDLKNGNLKINLEVKASQLTLSLPTVTDIRTLRKYTEQIQPRPTYEELSKKNIAELKPRFIVKPKKSKNSTYSFFNVFTDDTGKQKKYGSVISVSDSANLTMNEEQLIFETAAEKNLFISITTLTNIKIEQRHKKKIFNPSYILPRDLFSPGLLEIYDQSQKFIEHLIRAKKTSSFEYGTIFPRDWIESADIGFGDLSQSTVDYMYRQSMQFVSEYGEGWHENIVGELKTKIGNDVEAIDRKMIDIEPRYVLGMHQMSKTLLTDQTIQKKLRAVAKYILKQAESEEQITFKKINNKAVINEAMSEGNISEYEIVGNWRDSALAFLNQKSPIAPYDVNCVFYPMSLRVIREFYRFFEVDDLEKLNALIEKWDKQKLRFRIKGNEKIITDKLISYSLALCGKNYSPLAISHLDESYDLTYGSPSLEEIISFAEKIMDPNFFFTPVGPLLVGRNETGFSTENYHGHVIWPKQCAFSVMGLSKQYRRGLREGWPWPAIETIKAAVVMTAEACFKGWEQLGTVPELYYFDQKENRARFYVDQEKYEAQMSMIQLWSSVGCRRIMQEYASVIKIAEAI